METIDRVARLVDQGKSTGYIAEKLRISTRSVGAYRAHITMRERTEDPFKKLEGYLQSRYIVIPAERIVDRLKPEQVHGFVDILDTLLGKQPTSRGLESTLTDQTSSNGELRPLPESEIREIIIDSKQRGLSYQEIRQDYRLKNVPWTSIRAYLAHYGRGTYSKERD